MDDEQISASYDHDMGEYDESDEDTQQRNHIINLEKQYNDLLNEFSRNVR